MFIEVLFFTGVFGVSYSYFVYPLILIVLQRFKKNRSEVSMNEKDTLQFISFIITAYNEEKQIAKKLENTLKVDYPHNKFEIIVASDGSTDQTNNIVKDYVDKGVILHHVPERKGKENAQKSAIAIAKGDILVFSDVSTQIETVAFQQISKRFDDKIVGAVSSEDRFITEDGEIAGEGAYVKYEMWLRKLESNVNSLVGLSGSFFAARKLICQDWNISIPSDFNTAMNCVRKNHIAITAPELKGYYPNLKDETQEYQRKVRTVIRGIAALLSQKVVMNPSKYKLFSFQVISHKLMRWLVPWFLILTFITNLFLWDVSIFYKLTLLAQMIFYALALMAWLSAQVRKSAILKIPYFFMQVNIAIGHASLQYLLGKRVTYWTPSKR